MAPIGAPLGLGIENLWRAGT